MDLIDASNAPVPITVDPITGNTISANQTENAMEDTQMADPEDHTNAVDNEAEDEAEDYFIDNSPTFHDFTTLPPDTKATITRLLASAGAAWEFRSMATPFPIQYLPDPDCHNWGLALISALSRLADMTRTGFKLEAIAFVIKHMKERNEVPGNTEDENIPASVVMAGDFVIRLEDVNYSIRKMRNRVNSYRPAPQGQGRGRGHGRGGFRGGRGRGRGRGGGARGRGGMMGFHG